MQEISKIVGDMWQKAPPDQKAPYIEQVSPSFQASTLQYVSDSRAYINPPPAEGSAEPQGLSSGRLPNAVPVRLLRHLGWQNLEQEYWHAGAHRQGEISAGTQ